MKTKRKNLNIVNPGGEEITTFSRYANFEEEEEFLEDDEQTEEEYNHELFLRTIDKIREGEDSRTITPDQATAYELQAIADYRDRLIQGLGYDPEEVDEFLDELEEDDDEDEDEDEGDYSSGVDIATFSAGNDFGTGLQMLIADDGYTDLQEGVEDLAKTLGLDAENTAGLLTGDFVPSQELIDQIAEIFELDDESYARLDDLGAIAREDAGYGDEDNEDEEDEGANYASQLEHRLAEFEYQGKIKDDLTRLELDARHGVEGGWLPPVVYRELIGNFELEGDQIAAFSASCEASQVNPETQLYAINYAIEAFRRCGPIINFSSIEEPLTEREVVAETSIRDQARRNRQYKQQRSN